MDDAGAPTKFKYRCGICGEEGRNRQSCQEEMMDGTYHWIMHETLENFKGDVV